MKDSDIQLKKSKTMFEHSRVKNKEVMNGIVKTLKLEGLMNVNEIYEYIMKYFSNSIAHDYTPASFKTKCHKLLNNNELIGIRKIGKMIYYYLKSSKETCLKIIDYITEEINDVDIEIDELNKRKKDMQDVYDKNYSILKVIDLEYLVTEYFKQQYEIKGEHKINYTGLNKKLYEFLSYKSKKLKDISFKNALESLVDKNVLVRESVMINMNRHMVYYYLNTNNNKNIVKHNDNVINNL